ncbi:deoxycytidylate deaminase [Clostridia bacterium]|nr:deoxycytidylate deaminase [Clostridia bacterium]
MNSEKFFTAENSDAELVFGLVGAVGTNFRSIVDALKERLELFRYCCEEIHISTDILEHHTNNIGSGNKANRIDVLMGVGNALRREFGFDILACASAGMINDSRHRASQNGNEAGQDKDEASQNADESRDIRMAPQRKAYIINSLKHYGEVKALRQVYSNGFYLIGVYEDQEQRKRNLHNKGISEDDIKKLMERDEDEKTDYGQHTRDTFHLSDFFVDITNGIIKGKLHRFIDLIFGRPDCSPTFGEYAMFMAYSSSLRSSDLSRQTGAAICKDDVILALGANDCPKYTGGLYWCDYDQKKDEYVDHPDGKDQMRKNDPNKVERENIMRDVLKSLDIEETDHNMNALRHSKLNDLTEYGRVVHAEMDAITTCARNFISTRDSEMYVTTFPCHNCAKHIIASGIKKIVYIEPYTKSKTLEFYNDSTTTDPEEWGKVVLRPFFGIGPRRYIDFFAMSSNFLPEKERKDSSGNAYEWPHEKYCERNVRSRLVSKSYYEIELEYSYKYWKDVGEIVLPDDKIDRVLSVNE